MNKLYKSIAFFLASFMFFMHPLALIATEADTSTSPSTLNINVTSKIPNSFNFTEDLYNGISSGQVKMLQILLNSDTRTIVNTTGAGSPGNETTYYGNATQNAVERFQNIYKTSILEPLNMTQPTGIIGSRSRSVLNQILSNLRANKPANSGIAMNSTSVSNSSNQSVFQSVTNSSTSSTSSTSTTVTVPLQIITTSVPSAKKGTPYYTMIFADGGRDTYNWSVLYGSLPTGITASGGTCVASPCKTPLTLSGTPNTNGSYTFIVRLASGNDYVTKEYVINIQDSSTQSNTQTSNNTTVSNTASNTTTTVTSSDTTSSSSSSSGSNIGLALGIVGGAAAVSAISSAASTATTAALPGFGGRIVFVQYCTCTAFILLYIFDFDKKAVLPLLYIPGYSKLLSQYNIWSPGPQVLGGYTYGATPCMVYAGTGCVAMGVPIGIIDAIRGIGSSL